ncbi:hypothetical protein LIA77_03812 [Sarocladium implicatum]|nr:hypothetical protein LIA77_03812 [Sarocladium implicatum]
MVLGANALSRAIARVHVCERGRRTRHGLQMQDECVQEKAVKKSLEGLLNVSLHGLHFACCCTHLCRGGRERSVSGTVLDGRDAGTVSERKLRLMDAYCARCEHALGLFMMDDLTLSDIVGHCETVIHLGPL